MLSGSWEFALYPDGNAHVVNLQTGEERKVSASDAAYKHRVANHGQRKYCYCTIAAR
jgi:hypothetical protein